MYYSAIVPSMIIAAVLILPSSLQSQHADRTQAIPHPQPCVEKKQCTDSRPGTAREIRRKDGVLANGGQPSQASPLETEIGDHIHTRPDSEPSSARTVPPPLVPAIGCQHPQSRTMMPPKAPFCYFDAIERGTGKQLESVSLHVSIEFHSPYENHDYKLPKWEVRVPDRFSISLPHANATVVVICSKPGYRDSAPLFISSDFFWRVANGPSLELLTHTFVLERAGSAEPAPVGPGDDPTDQPCTNMPIDPSAFLLISAVDRRTGDPIGELELVVQETNPPPYEYYDRAYRLKCDDLSDLIHFTMPPDHTTAHIVGRKPGYADSEPLNVTYDFYWANLGNPYILKHCFELEPVTLEQDTPDHPTTDDNLAGESKARLKEETLRRIERLEKELEELRELLVRLDG